VEAILGPRVSGLAVRARLEHDPEVVRALESNPELAFRVEIVVAALAGKIIRNDESLEVVAQMLKEITLTTETPLAEFVAQVKTVLDIHDGMGAMAEMMEAGEGVGDEDLMSYRAALMNKMQHVNLLWVADAGDDVKTLTGQAKAVVKAQIKWAEAQGLDIAGRFNIEVINKATALKDLKEFATRKYDQLKGVARGTGQEIDPLRFFVLTGTGAMLDLVDSEAVRAQAELIERENFEDAGIRGVARFVTAALSQDVLSQAELLNNRTQRFLEKDGDRYRLNPMGLKALAQELWTKITAAFSLARSA